MQLLSKIQTLPSEPQKCTPGQICAQRSMVCIGSWQAAASAPEIPACPHTEPPKYCSLGFERQIISQAQHIPAQSVPIWLLKGLLPFARPAGTSPCGCKGLIPTVQGRALFRMGTIGLCCSGSIPVFMLRSGYWWYLENSSNAGDRTSGRHFQGTGKCFWRFMYVQTGTEFWRPEDWVDMSGCLGWRGR